MDFHNLIGLIGVGLTLIAYFLLVAHKISARSFFYPILNLVGSVMIIYSLFHAWNLASFVMECAWLGISVYGIYQVVKNRSIAKK